MTQDERWMENYKKLVGFIESNHRYPSRHRIEEHDMLNWLKATRKRNNGGDLKPEWLEMFSETGTRPSGSFTIIILLSRTFR